MCETKECPDCHLLIPVRAVVCTSNGCHHVFKTEGTQIDTVFHSYHDAGMEPPEFPNLRHLYVNRGGGPLSKLIH